MVDDLASANVNRSYSLSGTSIAIFTFMLIFLFPRFVSHEIDPLLFQVTLAVMALATFAFVFTSFFYYGASLAGRIDERERTVFARRGDRLWLAGYTLLLLDPSLILFTVGLVVVGAVWLALWLVYVFVVFRYFPRVLTVPPSSRR